MKRTVYIALLVAVTATIAALSWRKWHDDLYREKPWDARVDWIAARAFIAGTNPYSPEALHEVKLDGLGHPPTTSFWMLPFSGLSERDMKVPFDLTMIAIFLVGLLLLFRELRVPLWHLHAVCFWIALDATSWMHYHLHVAQLSCFIGTLGLFAWLAARRGRDFLTGLFLGFACTMKFYPGIFGVALLGCRRWRVLAGGIAGYVPIFLIMTLRFGFVAWPQYFASEKIIVNMWVGNVHNTSLYGVVCRLFTPTCFGYPHPPAPHAMQVASISALALIAFSLWLTHRPLVERRIDLAWVFLTVVSVFANPFAFEHYFVLEVFPVVIAVFYFWQLRRAKAPRAQLVTTGTLLAIVILLLARNHWWLDDANRARHHALGHLHEVLNWIHQPILLVAIALELRWSRGRVVTGPGAVVADAGHSVAGVGDHAVRLQERS